MFLALLMFAHLLTSRPHLSVAVVRGPAVSAHVSHEAHARHLAHLHHLHVQHLRAVSPPSRHVPVVRAAVTSHASTALSGRLGCRGLESLWESAGGRSSAAFMAAEVAMAESGGNQYATGPAGERGYWQIHPDHGALSTYDPFGNARAAIIISDDGRSWLPWTTYTSGVFRGRC